MPSVLIIGATRGLGASLAKEYASESSNTVYATTRSHPGPSGFPQTIQWLPNIDLTRSTVGDDLTQQLEGKTALDAVVRTQLPRASVYCFG
jgi:NAD(P)-dependent dehydrogenase (short-subunit alcohol dehydrogenase family)